MFNPAIIQPRWPRLAEPILELWGQDTANAEDVVVIPEVSKFRIGTITMQAERARFQIIDEAPAGRRVADFIDTLFVNTLEHTPCSAVGINYECLVQCGSREERDRIGYTLAPPNVWGKFANDLQRPECGLLKQSIRLPLLFKDYDSNRTVTITADNRDNPVNFKIHVNSHVGLGVTDLPIERLPHTSKILPEILEIFDPVIAESILLCDQVISLGK